MQPPITRSPQADDAARHPTNENRFDENRWRLPRHELAPRRQMSDALPSWRATPPKSAIVEFIAAVTDAESDSFVPEADRIAVFDNDGTLSTENPYTQLAFAIDRSA